jgi:hypothetical protein
MQFTQETDDIWHRLSESGRLKAVRRAWKVGYDNDIAHALLGWKSSYSIQRAIDYATLMQDSGWASWWVTELTKQITHLTTTATTDTKDQGHDFAPDTLFCEQRWQSGLKVWLGN